MPLTKVQRDLLSEAQRIAQLTQLDYASVEERNPPSIRTMALHIAIHRMVVAEIVSRYTHIDEILAQIIARYFFERPGVELDFIRLWRTKKFTVFCQRILDEIYLLKKMELVHAIKKLPPDISSPIQRLNSIRNAFAHSFFPENRKEHKKHKKVLYKGKNIRSYEGLMLFVEDTHNAYEYLLRRMIE